VARSGQARPGQARLYRSVRPGQPGYAGAAMLHMLLPYYAAAIELAHRQKTAQRLIDQPSNNDDDPS
jgi:hypothetical protein